MISKGGSGKIYIPLMPDDPLYVPGGHSNFMILTRATNQPGPDGILGTADDVHAYINADLAVRRPEPDLCVGPVAPGIPAPVHGRR